MKALGRDFYVVKDPAQAEFDGVMKTLKNVHLVNRMRRLHKEADALRELLRKEGQTEAAASLRLAADAIEDGQGELR